MHPLRKKSLSKTVSQETALLTFYHFVGIAATKVLTHFVSMLKTISEEIRFFYSADGGVD